MSNSQVTQEKIRALLGELRTWDVDEERYSLEELTVKFGLDVFVVDRIACSEGFHLKRGTPPEAPDWVSDPNAVTLNLDPEEIQKALRHPEARPDDHPDQDTGVWKKKPTGEWERIPPGAAPANVEGDDD